MNLSCVTANSPTWIVLKAIVFVDGSYSISVIPSFSQQLLSEFQRAIIGELSLMIISQRVDHKFSL